MENTLDGYFMYQELHVTQQVSIIKEYFDFFLNLEKFDTIIELGTSLAGLTYIIDDICVENKLNKNIHTFDNAYRDYVENYLKERNIKFYVMDEHTEEFKTIVKDLILNGGKTLVLCDGGNKIEEFNYYSSYIKQNDFIMAHDYCPNKTIFEEEIKNKIWNWHEIQLSDINTSINTNELIEYKRINFNDVVWACYKKK
jgi:hypothetical protein